MELRTRVNISKSPFKITYNDPVMFIGSCFASSIGTKMQECKMPVMINPAGTVYNPVSTINTLNQVISGVEFTPESLYFHNGKWLSFNHYTDFAADDPAKALEKINKKLETSVSFLAGARVLFVTFGTARVFRFIQTGEIVSNCHRIPSEMFQRELLTVEEIVELWKNGLDILHEKYPELRVVFTISPVRHWKDGAHGNQVSKSVLLLAVEELLKHPSGPGYFPAYEIMMDELRDYRFYSDDMLHPSGMAIDYIWEMFTEEYFDEKTINTCREAIKITKSMNHRLGDNSSVKTFVEGMLKRITRLENEIPCIDFSKEKIYFSGLLENQ